MVVNMSANDSSRQVLDPSGRNFACFEETREIESKLKPRVKEDHPLCFHFVDALPSQLPVLYARDGHPMLYYVHQVVNKNPKH